MGEDGGRARREGGREGKGKGKGKGNGHGEGEKRDEKRTHLTLIVDKTNCTEGGSWFSLGSNEMLWLVTEG